MHGYTLFVAGVLPIAGCRTRPEAAMPGTPPNQPPLFEVVTEGPVALDDSTLRAGRGPPGRLAHRGVAVGHASGGVNETRHPDVAVGTSDLVDAPTTKEVLMSGARPTGIDRTAAPASGRISFSTAEALRDECVPVLLYYFAYLAYLFATLEGEAGHWITLVALPLLMVMLLRRVHGRPTGIAAMGAAVGLRRGRLTTGLGIAAAVGLVLAGLQLVISRSREQILEALTSASALYLLPLAFVLLLATAAFTEELFFRGILLSRLRARWGVLPALLASSFLFGLYHLPYAYLHPRWPSHGDWEAALGSAMGQGGIAGLILGGVYLVARGNLLAPVLVHALINLPAVLAMLPDMVRFGGQS